ncbi:conidiophore development hymA protein [Rutstroemia sp. NJR-2017a BVV2]|nr:conidiophore development hymA protein [Rutstroemia sp. NJR-2017a BVV2]
MPTKTRPIETFAQAVAKCSTEASAYGKCIVADYNSVHKDKCLTEFMRLKNCYLVYSDYLDVDVYMLTII